MKTSTTSSISNPVHCRCCRKEAMQSRILEENEIICFKKVLNGSRTPLDATSTSGLISNNKQHFSTSSHKEKTTLQKQVVQGSPASVFKSPDSQNDLSFEASCKTPLNHTKDTSALLNVLLHAKYRRHYYLSALGQQKHLIRFLTHWPPDCSQGIRKENNSLSGLQENNVNVSQCYQKLKDPQLYRALRSKCITEVIL